MKSTMKILIKYLILFLIGAGTYYFIEIVWDGSSHWTMAALGGICFVLVGLINEFLSWQTPIWLQGVIGAAIITLLEFISGLFLNIWLGLYIWDYSNVPFNLLGQICLPFTIAWVGLAVLAVIIDDWLRYWLFGEEKPHYKIF